jgi:GT2 family glycosyltransferase
MNDVSVLVVSYNTRDLLRDCLATLHAYVPDSQTIVVDNASDDGSGSHVAAEFPAVELIANAQNVGFARAVNQGLQRVKGQFVLLLNADTRLQRDTVIQLRRFAQDHPHAGVIGPAQRRVDGRPARSAYFDPTLIREFARLILFADVAAARLYKGAQNTDSPRRVDWLMGTGLFIRRETIENIGGLDEGVFMYGEDWDFCRRARLSGWEVWLVPAACLIHHENASGAQFYNITRAGAVARSLFYFYDKHYGQTHRRWLAALHWLGAALRAVLLISTAPIWHRKPILRLKWCEQIYVQAVARAGLEVKSIDARAPLVAP